MLQQAIMIMDSMSLLSTCKDGSGKQKHDDWDNRADDDSGVAGSGRLRNRPAGSKDLRKTKLGV